MPETPTKIQPTADASRKPSKQERLKSALFISLSASVAVYVGMIILDQLSGLLFGITYGVATFPIAFVVALAIVWKVKTKPSLDKLTRILVLVVLALGPILSLILSAMGMAQDFGSSFT